MSAVRATLQRALVPALVLLLTLLAVGFLWWQIEETVADAERQAQQAATLRAAQLADAMAGQITSLLGAMDAGLQEVRAAWVRDPAEVPRIAKTVLATLPEGLVTHLSIVDAEGYTGYSTVAGSPRIYVGDRPHFRSQQDGADRLLIGKPVQARLVQEWSFIVNRPLLRDGRFAGTVNLSVRADALAALLGNLQLSKRDLVALLGSDGAFLARSMDNAAAMGKAVSATRPYLTTDAPERGQFHQPGSLDQVNRIFAWRRLPAVGLIITVGLDEDTLLAPMRVTHRVERRTAAMTSAVLMLGGLLLAGLYARLQRQGRQLQEDNLLRRQAESELARSHAELEQRVAERTAELGRQSRRNELILGTAIDGFFSADARGGIRDANQAYCAMLGYTRDEMLQLAIPDVEARESAQDVAEHIEKVRRQGYDRFETRHRRKDGGTIDVEISVNMAELAGEPLMFAFARDITERKQAEQLLAASRDEADRANRAKSEFLSRMSHELRTPMNAILGFGQLLETDAEIGDRRRGWAREIVAGGRHLLELINDVLDLARVESGRFTVSPESVALRPLIDDCLTLLRPLADASDVRQLEATRHCDVHVRADRTRLKQVLLNLLSNAIKYNRRRGSVNIVCVAEAANTPPTVQVRITDSGPGLTADEQARLFVPFERLHADEAQIEGTGIGLALSRKLLEIMGGEIGVESTPGSGSTFWIRVPLAAGEEHEPVPPPASPSATTGIDAGPRHDVLCIEDNPANLRLIESIFMHRPSVRLLTALAPGLGLELARTHRPALILLDINLPEMDGYAVIQCLREHEATRAIPVVAISANAMPKDLERGKAAGFAAYVTKPIDMSRLLALVDGLLYRGIEGPSA